MKPTDATSVSKDPRKCTYKEVGKLLTISVAPNALAERVKELNCLYSISNLLENQDVDINWILARAVELIPAALQFPELACARIRL
ncbi:MAG: hypothetical protein EHM37_05945, partial [Deltaproteobacteria bacterium]